MSARRPSRAPEWETDRLDLPAYLTRIGDHGDLEPTAATLRRLHRAHATAIPFENLEVALGGIPLLDLDGLQDKLVRRRRGGYCYEHNLLFGAVLERLGFAVTRLAARTGSPEQLRPRSHMTLLVHDAAGGSWLADVGFGAALLDPVRFAAGAICRQDEWTFRLDRGPGELWRLGSLHAGAWSDLYSFGLDAQHHVDYVVTNHFTATHPSSPFTGQAVAMRTEHDHRLTLRGRELTTSFPDGTDEHRRLSDDEVVRVLTDTFQIDLDSIDVADLHGLMTRP